MKRITFRITKRQREEAERLVEIGEYPNLSEAIRSLVRRGLNDHPKVGQRPSEKWRDG